MSLLVDVFVLRMAAWLCEVAQLVFLWGLLFFFNVVVNMDLSSHLKQYFGKFCKKHYQGTLRIEL